MARVLSKKQKMEQMMIARITILSVAGGEMVTIYGVGKWRIVVSVVAVKVVAMVVFFFVAWWHQGGGCMVVVPAVFASSGGTSIMLFRYNMVTFMILNLTTFLIDSNFRPGLKLRVARFDFLHRSTLPHPSPSKTWISPFLVKKKRKEKLIVNLGPMNKGTQMNIQTLIDQSF